MGCMLRVSWVVSCGCLTLRGLVDGTCSCQDGIPANWSKKPEASYSSIACTGPIFVHPHPPSLQSKSNESTSQAMAFSFIQRPHGEALDWMLRASLSSCHVSVRAAASG